MLHDHLGALLGATQQRRTGWLRRAESAETMARSIAN